MINKGELVEINKAVFSTGDVYLLDNDVVIYIWIGSKCSVDEKTSGAAQAIIPSDCYSYELNRSPQGPTMEFDFFTIETMASTGPRGQL